MGAAPPWRFRTPLPKTDTRNADRPGLNRTKPDIANGHAPIGIVMHSEP